MNITKETVLPFIAWGVDYDGKIKEVKIVRTYIFAAFTSRGKRYSSKDLAAGKSSAIKLAERKLKVAMKRIQVAQAAHDAIARNIEAAKASA